MALLDQSSYFPFFQRNGLNEHDRLACNAFARQHYQDGLVYPIEQQGWCSYTLVVCYRSPCRLIGEEASPPPKANQIIQFRPQDYRINLDIASAAKDIYANFAPVTLSLGTLTASDGRDLFVYAQTCIRGEAYSLRQPTKQDLDPDQRGQQLALIRSFANLLARGWHFSKTNPHRVQPCNGKVGAKMRAKIEQAAHELPTPTLRKHARRVLAGINAGGLERLPVVLCHGDLIPSNMLVFVPESVDGTAAAEAEEVEAGLPPLPPAAIVGLVDWAEAEWLPFGTCLYGLEYLLGYFNSSGGAGVGAGGCWVYYSCANELRAAFWRELELRIPELIADDDGNRLREASDNHSSPDREVIQLARDMGVLLWFGFAWDDGRIDRVVGVHDANELRYLEAFLGCDERAKI